MKLRVVTYSRISKDRAGDAHGVANQQAALDKYAAGRGWKIVARLSDNDLSAYNGQRRPGYEQALAMVDAGQCDVVLCWAVDRFVRRIADLEAVIERFTKAGVRLAAVSGDLDLTTDAGRTVARMLSVIAQGEVERKGTRQRLANEAAARAGKRWRGCPRPFGFRDDYVTPHPDEAAAILRAAQQLLAGGTMASAARLLDSLPVAPPQGAKRWSVNSVKAMLRNPALAGLASYHAEVVGQGSWEPVLVEPTWRAVLAILDDPSRRNPAGTRTLLGGLGLCGSCGNRVSANLNGSGVRVYRCQPASRDGRPGPHATILLEPTDDWVEAVIVERLSRPDVADLLAPVTSDTAALRAEALSIRAGLDRDAVDELTGQLTRSQLLARSAYGQRRLEQIAAELAAAGSTSALAAFAAGERAAEVWASLDLSRRQAAIRALCTVTLLPAAVGANTWDGARVRITPR